MLRVSVTDRCNFRCGYCMPADGVRWLPKNELLDFEEIETVVRTAVDAHGIDHVKLTGGEPTLRPGIIELVSRLRRVPGITDLSMTTNGFALADLAEPLRAAGLDRITVSIDSLDPEKFRRITRTGDLSKVRAGIDAALMAGLRVKLNVVAMRGVNDDEFADFAELTRSTPMTVRFIEYMPLGDSAFYDGAGMDEIGPAGGCGAPRNYGDVFIAEGDIRARIGDLEPADPDAGVGPAIVWRLPGGIGKVGFISAMSAPFCSTCNRLRLTATGVLRSCLFDGGEVDLRPLLPTRDLADAFVECVAMKPDTHSQRGNEQMSRIGG